MSDPQWQLASPPADGIASVRFSKVSNNLTTASWDKGVRVYDAQQNQLRIRFAHQSAALDATFNEDDSKVFSGGLDKQVAMYVHVP